MISDAATTQVAALYRFVRLENYEDLRELPQILVIFKTNKAVQCSDLCRGSI